MNKTRSKEQKLERERGRVESVKEWHKTNKNLFSLIEACVVQMEVILTHLCSKEFVLVGIQSVCVRPGMSTK